MTSNQDIKKRHDAVMFPNVANFYKEAVALKEGKGSRVTDHDGTEYLDFFGGILTVSVGHANEHVNKMVKEQIDRLAHVSTLYPTLPMVELAERLVKLAPGKIDRAFFCASGTEADETAVGLAQTHTGSTELVALRHGYSGRSLLAQSLTAHSPYRAVQTQIAGVKHAMSPYCYRCPFKLTPDSCQRECAQDIEEVIRTTTTGKIAGILAEPIQGVGGFITPPDDYWKIVYDIVKKYGGVFIADEVQTGFGRTGKMWGVDGYGIEPDIMTMAKGIANGFALSACLATTDITMSQAGKGSISTYGGNPVSTTAGMAVLDEIENNNLIDNAAQRGGELREALEGLQRKYPKLIGDVRGKGLMQAIELVVDETAQDRTPNPAAVVALFEETKKRKLLIGKGGLNGNVVRISPALNVSADDIKEAVATMDESFAALKSN